MARLNIRPHHPHGHTHEGAPAAPANAEEQLRRSVMSCMLWENEFYEDGEEISARIQRLASMMPRDKLAQIAIYAREQGNLRHVPLLLCSVLAKNHRGDSIVGATIERVIQRADELTEFLAIHAKLNKVDPKAVKKTISSQMKKGIGAAFAKFDEYQLAKYDRAGAIRLLDVMRLTHGKPPTLAIKELRDKLKADKLDVPDTWEANLVAGKDKKETFTRLLQEGKLGYLALLRNLRNMAQSGVDDGLVRDAILARKGAHRVLPFRYVAAARAAPQFERALDQALCSSIAEAVPLPGKTLVLVDVSGSMDAGISGKSDMNRIDAAAALASIIPGDVRMFSFSERVVEVPPRRGMAGVDAIKSSQHHSGTYLGQAVAHMNVIAANNGMAPGATRLICISDEQSHDPVPDPVMKHAYMINVASNQRGVAYGKWTHMDGFSESVLKFVREKEWRDDRRD